MFFENISEVTLRLSDRPDKLSKPIYVPRKPVVKDHVVSPMTTSMEQTLPATIASNATAIQPQPNPPIKVKRKPVGDVLPVEVHPVEASRRVSNIYDNSDDSDDNMRIMTSATPPLFTTPWSYHVLKNFKDFYLTTNPTEEHLDRRVGPSYYVTTSVSTGCVVRPVSEAATTTRINSRHSATFRSLSMLKREDELLKSSSVPVAGISTNSTEGLVFNFQTAGSEMEITRWKSFSGGNTWLDIKITVSNKDQKGHGEYTDDESEDTDTGETFFTNAIPIPNTTPQQGPSYAIVYNNDQYVVGPKSIYYSNGKPKHSTKVWFSSLGEGEEDKEEINYAVFRRRKNALQLALHLDQIVENSSDNAGNGGNRTNRGTEKDAVGQLHDVDKIGWLTISPLDKVTKDPMFWNLVLGVTTVVAYATRVDDKDKRLSGWFKKINRGKMDGGR